MASTYKTNNIKLNQWIGSDKPQRTDFNDDNMIIDTEITNLKSSINLAKNIYANALYNNATGKNYTITDYIDDTNLIVTMYGTISEIGEGERTPDNPYTLSGATQLDISINGISYNKTLDTELYAIGNYQDNIDLSTGICNKYIRKIIITGTSNIVKVSDNTTTVSYKFTPNENIDINAGITCNKLSYAGISITGDYEHCMIAASTSNIVFYINKERFSGSNINDWLNDNPLEFYYAVTQPITTQSDNYIIDFETAVNPVVVSSNIDTKIKYNRDINSALLDLIEYTVALETRIAQLEINTEV